VKLLIENGADVDKENIQGDIYLFMAFLYSNEDIVKILIENRTDLNKRIADGWTPLTFAISNEKYCETFDWKWSRCKYKRWKLYNKQQSLKKISKLIKIKFFYL